MTYYRPFPYLNLPIYSGWTWGSPAIPNIYWNAYSQEQRIKNLCLNQGKVEAYLDENAESLNQFVGEAATAFNTNMENFDKYFDETDEIVESVNNMMTQQIYNIPFASTIESIFKEKFALFFGDEFMTNNAAGNNQLIPERIAHGFEFTSNHIKNYSNTGAGWTISGNSIYTQETTAWGQFSNNTSNAENVALIVAMAGMNDIASLDAGTTTVADIENYIRGFISRCNVRYPNANIVVVPFNFGFGGLSAARNADIINVMSNIYRLQYTTGSVTQRFTKIIPFAWTWTLGLTARLSSATTLSERGADMIAGHIMSVIMGGTDPGFVTAGHIVYDSNDELYNTSTMDYYVFNGFLNIKGAFRLVNSSSGNVVVSLGTAPAIITPNNNLGFILPIHNATDRTEMGHLTINKNGTMALNLTSHAAGNIGTVDFICMPEVNPALYA